MPGSYQAQGDFEEVSKLFFDWAALEVVHEASIMTGEETREEHAALLVINFRFWTQIDCYPYLF